LLERIIAEYRGHQDGPLFIVTGGLHGNEMAGVNAIRRMEFLLREEEALFPEFIYNGRFVGISGNIPALLSGERLIDLDLNRVWLDNLNDIKQTSAFKEMSEIHITIQNLIEEHTEHYPVIIMDLHTTSSPRGIFAVCTNTARSKKITGALHCPVITNMTAQLRGSMIQYYSSHSVFNRDITSFAFEGGQHNDEHSVSRLIAGMVNCMRTINAVSYESVESKHDEILSAYTQGLPKYCVISYVHRIDKASLWKMKPGYQGFQKVKKGEIVASYAGEPVAVPHDGYILMPLYQKSGNEGFFIVEEEES
jgi:succinylglutamate desuccinylase